MFKLVDGRFFRVANTTQTDINHTSSEPGEYLVAAFSASGQVQSYQITLTK
jgi:hypothetical protein